MRKIALVTGITGQDGAWLAQLCQMMAEVGLCHVERGVSF